MFKLLFRASTYFIIWKKFNRQIVLIGLSILALIFINFMYRDLFELLEKINKNSLVWAFLSKWILIILIILYNIRKLKSISLSKEDKEKILHEVSIEKPLKKEAELLKDYIKLLEKEKLTSATEKILSKYKNK